MGLVSLKYFGDQKFFQLEGLIQNGSLTKTNGQ